MTRSFGRGVPAGLALAWMMCVLGPVAGPVAMAQEPHAASAADTKPESAGAKQEEADENDAYRHSAMVTKIGSMMGMDSERAATAFEWANFAVLAGLVGFGLVKVLPKTIRDRNTGIQKYLVDARTATEEATARLSVVEERLGKLDGQIAAMQAQSEQDAARDEARIKASVEEEKSKILAAAEQEIAAATGHAQKALQQYAAELAIEQAARKLVVSAETDRLLVQQFAERLGGGESKKGQN